MTGQTPEDLYLVNEAEPDSDFPVTEAFTLGRHLDNDLIVPGEDVDDYHARGQLDERGVLVVPLGEAVLEVNDAHIDQPWRIAPGDVIGVGSNRIRLIDRGGIAEEPIWHAHYKGEKIRIRGALTIGRSPRAGISFNNSHISREHARLFVSAGLLWLTDLNSSNGTFVNGKRLCGGCRLFHGDELAFDQIVMQVIAQGQDLTPMRERAAGELDNPLRMPVAPGEEIQGTIEMRAVDVDATVSAPEPQLPGSYLIGQNAPIAGQVFPLRFGTTTIGREAGTEIRIDEPSVSARHAEVVYRADGVAIANLFSTNGTRVNGAAVVNTKLTSGDFVSIGNVTLKFHVTEAGPGRPRPRWVFIAAVAAMLAAAAASLLI
ncbi:MAG: FHA domain-containing protein [Pseudomonadota bacterium]